MMERHWQSIVALSLAVTAAACSKPAEERREATPAAQVPAASTAPSAPGTSKTDYPIRGRVEAVASDRTSVTLDHEEIPGFMAAMKMEYKLANAALATGLKAGDRVSGTLEVRGTDYTITALKKQ